MTEELDDKDIQWLMERQVDSYLVWIGLWLVCLLGNVTILTQVALSGYSISSTIVLLVFLLYIGLISSMVFSAYYVTFNIIKPHIRLVNILENTKLKNYILENRTTISQFFVNNKGVSCIPNFISLAILHFAIFLPLFYYALIS